MGQVQAREALGIHLGLLKEGRYSGRPLLLVGPPGTGKVSDENQPERTGNQLEPSEKAPQAKMREARSPQAGTLPSGARITALQAKILSRPS